MNIITHETERIRELQRQLQEAEQFRALVTEMRQHQRGRSRNDGGNVHGQRARLEAAVDRELRLLESE